LRFLADSALYGYSETLISSFYKKTLDNPDNEIVKAEFERFCDLCLTKSKHLTLPDSNLTDIIKASLHLNLPNIFKAAVENRDTQVPLGLFRSIGTSMGELGFSNWMMKDG